MNDAMKQIRTTEQITAGSPVYRVVTSEKWSIVVSLTKEQYIKIAKKDSVSVKIKKDNIVINKEKEKKRKKRKKKSASA